MHDEQIKQLATELSALKAHPVEAKSKGNPDAGKKLYISNCAACHGGKGEGNTQLNAPSLKTTDAQYLKRQLQNFAAGIRGSHKEDKYGRQMAMMAKTLPNEQVVDDVIAFILSL